MQQKMKAAVLHGINDLCYEEVDMPSLGAHDVLVKVSASGVCGSDIPRVTTQGTYHFPTIPGHEFGGIVVEVGEKADSKLLNEMVAVIPLIPCRKCKSCEIGDFAQCEDYDFLGSRSDGGFAEYVKVPEKNLVIVPNDINPEAVAFLEPIAVALHVVENNGVHFGDDVIVYGLGAIGIFIAQWAKAFGARHVFAIDIDPRKVEIAKKVGLKDALCSKDVDVLKIVKEKTNQEGCDIAFEASGSEFVFNQSLETLKQNGRLGLVGRPVGSLEVYHNAFEAILRKQITIKGTWSFEFKRFPHHAWTTSLNALKDKKILTEPIVSHRLPLSQVENAIKIMENKNEFFYKILIKPEMK